MNDWCVTTSLSASMLSRAPITWCQMEGIGTYSSDAGLSTWYDLRSVGGGLFVHLTPVNPLLLCQLSGNQSPRLSSDKDRRARSLCFESRPRTTPVDRLRTFWRTCTLNRTLVWTLHDQLTLTTLLNRSTTRKQHSRLSCFRLPPQQIGFRRTERSVPPG